MVALFVVLALGGLSGRTKVSELAVVELETLGPCPFDVPSRARKGLIMILFGDPFLIKV